jgi:hypothetical protein
MYHRINTEVFLMFPKKYIDVVCLMIFGININYSAEQQ